MWQRKARLGPRHFWATILGVACINLASVNGYAREWNAEAAYGKSSWDVLISTNVLEDLGVKDLGKQYDDLHAKPLATSIGMEVSEGIYVFLRTSIWRCDDCDETRRWVDIPPDGPDSIRTAVLEIDAWGGSAIVGLEKRVLKIRRFEASIGCGLGPCVNSFHLSTKVRMESGAEKTLTRTQSGVGLAMSMRFSVSLGNPGVGLAGGYGLTDVSRIDSGTRYSYVEGFIRL